MNKIQSKKITKEHFTINHNLSDTEKDFLPELHGERNAEAMVTHHNEQMSTKTSNTADARQKRGQKGS
jgi:hypothetical protein